MELGLSSYSYGWAVGVPGHPPPRPMTEDDLLDCVRGFDLKLLQIGDNLPLHTFSAERLDRLAGRARSDQIKLEIGTRGLTVERVARYAAIARKLGARLIRIVIDDAGPRPRPDEVAGTLK